MKTPSSGLLGIRKRSPSRAPPLSGLCGSQASTATFWPWPRSNSISLPTRVLLPTPPLPVMATTRAGWGSGGSAAVRSEEHTSELQSRPQLVCRLLLDKKKQIKVRDDTLCSLHTTIDHTITVFLN